MEMVTLKNVRLFHENLFHYVAQREKMVGFEYELECFYVHKILRLKQVVQEIRRDILFGCQWSLHIHSLRWFLLRSSNNRIQNSEFLFVGLHFLSRLRAIIHQFRSGRLIGYN